MTIVANVEVDSSKNKNVCQPNLQAEEQTKTLGKKIEQQDGLPSKNSNYWKRTGKQLMAGKF